MPTRTHSNLCAQAGNTNLQCHEHFKFFSFPSIFLFAYPIWGLGGAGVYPSCPGMKCGGASCTVHQSIAGITEHLHLWPI